MSLGEFFQSLGFSILPILVLVLFALVFSSYVKIVTVLAIIRAGLGSASLPGAFVTGSLALVLSFFVMYPTMEQTFEAMSSKQVQGSAGQAKAIDAGVKKWKEFLVAHTDEELSKSFASKILNKQENISPENSELELKRLQKSWRVLAPAFFVGQLRDAFKTGLSLFLPFVIIDLCIAQVLVAVGIQRLDPLVVALPFKLLLFVLLDGWTLISTNLVEVYF